MILLDTDHVSVLQVPAGDRRFRLVARLALLVGEVVGTTIVTVEEQLRGWLAEIARHHQPRRQLRAYQRLNRMFAFYRPFPVVDFDEAAADRYDALSGVRIKAMDKKIAAIALANDALLLTANRQDFEKVPGLRFENWMDG